MPLLYDEVEIDEWTETMLLTERFTPPRNGRMLRFRLSDGSRRKLLYTCIDGNYAGPFSAENGAVTVENGIGILEALRAGCHAAQVIAVDVEEFLLDPLEIPVSPVIVTLSDGEQAAVRIYGEAEISIRVRDSDLLMEEEVKRGKVTAPERRAERIIKKCLKREISRKMPQIITTGHVLEGIADLVEEADSIGQTAASHAEQMLPWLEVVSCEVTLEVLDLDESILEKENYRWRQKEAESAEQRAMQMRLVEKAGDALIAAYGQSAIPPEMLQIVAVYAQNQPMVSADELTALCGKLKALSEKYTPELLLKNVKALTGGVTR